MSSPTAPIQFACTNCGAHLSVDGSTQTPTCVYCKTEMLLPEAVWRRFHPAPPPPQLPGADAMAAAAAVRRTVVPIIVAVTAVTILGVAIALIGVYASTRGVSGLAGQAKTPSLLDPIAAAGQPCNGRRAACSGDGKAQLLCDANDTMEVAQTCKGPNACRASHGGKSVTCDTTLGDVGDPCDITDDACSTDHAAELHCQAGRFAVLATCKGPDGCTLTPSAAGSGYTLSCDDHVADVGDPCFDTERTACSSDKRALLTCTAQRFVVHRACKRGCTVKKIVGTGNKALDCD